MATNHLKETVAGLIRSIQDSAELEGVLHKGYPFYAFGHSSYQVNPGELTISIIVGDSEGEDPFINDSTSTDILPTEILIVADTVFSNDDELWLSEDKETLIDYEYIILRALQEDAFWISGGNKQGWSVAPRHPRHGEGGGCHARDNEVGNCG